MLKKISYLLDEADKALKDSCDSSGSLSIGANHTISGIRLPELLEQYNKAYPKVNLSLTTTKQMNLFIRLIIAFFVKNLSICDENMVK